MKPGLRARERCATALRLAFYAGACVVLSGAKRLVPLPVLARAMWRDPRGPRDPRREARDVAAVLTATRWLGMRGRGCFQRSLLLYRLLSRSGANPRLVIGFRRQGNGVEGHAWVKVDGRPIGDLDAGAAAFTPLASFGRNGDRCPPG
jgi:hypothetical protein